MYKAKSILEPQPYRRRLMTGIGLLTGMMLLLGAASTPSASQQNPSPAKKITAPKMDTVTPVGAGGRLEALDRLRSDIEIWKLRRDLAKVQAEEREARAPTTALSSTVSTGPAPNLAMPPLPSQGVYSVMPPLGQSGGGGSSFPRSAGPAPSSGTAQSARFVEAWGDGQTRQARLSTPAGPRIVKLGDSFNGKRVVEITAGQVVLRDQRGRLHHLD